MIYVQHKINNRKYRWAGILGSIIFLSISTSSVHAESLKKALGRAYLKNPTLNAQRATLRSTDEGVAIANSGYRPTVTGSGTVQYQDINSPNPLLDGDEESQSYSVTLSQPIFRSGRITNAVKEAKANVFAAREDLRNVEQSILLSGVTSYNDVVRDQSIVRLNQNNVNVLTKQRDATKDRFEVGEVTRTDVAQANARRSGSVSTLSLAKGNLKSSQATYQQVIGHFPSRLRQPGSIAHMLPKTLDDALKRGEEDNPVIIAAKFREKAADFAVDKNVSELLPEVNLDASYSRGFSSDSLSNDVETTTVTGRLTVPLYQSGAVSASIRQAKQLRAQRLREVQAAVLEVRAQVISAWSNLQSSRAQLKSDLAQVDANKIALNGVREEEKVGQRTVLDILDAEQELLDAQVALSTTRRNLVVAEYTLLSAIGRLTARDLGLEVPLYDAKAYYRKVKGKWFGLGTDADRSYNRYKDRKKKHHKGY